jgi:hypothetical protein
MAFEAGFSRTLLFYTDRELILSHRSAIFLSAYLLVYFPPT